MFDYIRIACAVPNVSVGNVETNAEDICAFLKSADEKQVDVLVFPELALTGYSCGDLFFQETLHNAVKAGLATILASSKEHAAVTAVVGLPVKIDGELYNCAAIITAGEVRALAVKTFLPDYGSYGERRWFSPASYLRRDWIQARELGIDAWYSIPVGNDLLIPLGDGAKLAVEICEDLWAPVSPAAMQALGGAEVIVNPAAAVETAGKKAMRRDMVKQSSERNACIYAFCGAGSTRYVPDEAATKLRPLLAESQVRIPRAERGL